jgi:uncharacterized protein (DUF697 family)
MPPETAFLDALAGFLAGPAGLSPAPALLGAAEPAAAAELPAVVLSLDEVHRLGAGLGERSLLITDGALPWQAAIDLANPVLASDPGFRLLSPDRLTLVLPHGGLKQADGSDGPLGPPDLSVKLGATNFTVVIAAPAAGEVRADPLVGVLSFGAALPATGTLRVNYVLGQWERRVTPIAGSVRIDIYGADSAAAATLSAAVLDALGAATTAEIRGLRKLALAQVGSIVATDAAHASARRRSAVLSFDYEHEINRPDSSGGVIRSVRVETAGDTETQVP